MERNNSLSIITTRKLIAPENNKLIDSPVTSAKKRRRSPVQLFKVALFMIRRRRSANSDLLNRFVGSMRPLHLQNDDNEIEIEIEGIKREESPKKEDEEESVVDDDGTMSSRYGSAANLQEMALGSSSSEDQSESRYASAVNLKDLDEEDEEEEEEENDDCSGEIEGDEMIDVKADLFIAQFYEQIRLQRLKSVDRRYNEMVERSIA